MSVRTIPLEMTSSHIIQSRDVEMRASLRLACSHLHLVNWHLQVQARQHLPYTTELLSSVSLPEPSVSGICGSDFSRASRFRIYYWYVHKSPHVRQLSFFGCWNFLALLLWLRCWDTQGLRGQGFCFHVA